MWAWVYSSIMATIIVNIIGLRTCGCVERLAGRLLGFARVAPVNFTHVFVWEGVWLLMEYS